MQITVPFSPLMGISQFNQKGLEKGRKKKHTHTHTQNVLIQKRRRLLRKRRKRNNKKRENREGLKATDSPGHKRLHRYHRSS